MAPTTRLSTQQAAGQIIRPDQHWTGNNGKPATIEYGFEESGWAFSSEQRIAARDVMGQWEQVARVTFVGGGDNLLFKNYRDGTDAGSAHWLEDPDSQIDQDVFGKSGSVGFNRDVNWGTAQLGMGQANRESLMHEVGHALGLKHPGNYNGPGATYAKDAGYVEDSRQFTVMSYFSEKSTGADFNGLFARTPLLHDIAAIQAMYGANMETRKFNDTYGFNSTAGPAYELHSAGEQAVFCIWDAGGVDKLDFSGYTMAGTIDLNAEHFSSVGGLTFNISIAAGVTIEDAVGGSGDETIFGNDADNRLDGGGGADTMWGGNGSDTLLGKDGNDTLQGGDKDDILDGGDGEDMLVGGGGGDNMQGGRHNDTYVVDDARDKVYEDASPEGGNADKIYTSLSSYDLSRYGKGIDVEILQKIGEGDFTGRGNDLHNILVGADGNDRLYGQAGNDLLNGGAGNDTLDGGTGTDTLNGEVGADEMRGGTGNDVYIVDNAGDQVIDTADQYYQDPATGMLAYRAGGIDKIYTTLNTYDLSAANKGVLVEELQFTGAGNFAGQGNSLKNVIVGADGSDTLSGGGGDDYLAGGIGQDDLDGGADKDTLMGEAGNDRLSGGGAADRLDGGVGADTMRGGAGDDTYVVDDVGDRVIEAQGFGRNPGDPGGIDTVETTRNIYQLGARVENLTYVGDVSFVGTGNDLNNVIQGRNGNRFGGAGDELSGGKGHDQIYGWGANDTLTGGEGHDGMDGGEGDDTFVADNGDAGGGDVVWGGVGRDEVRADASVSATGLRLNLFADGTAITPEVNLVANTSAAIGVEAVTGGTGNDVVDASRLSQGEAVEVSSLAGDDTFRSGAGSDTFNGGADTDTIELAGASANFAVARLAGEANAFQIANRTTGSVDTVREVELVRFTDGTFNLADRAEADANIVGTEGDDRLAGNIGANRIEGLGGNDTLSGGAGADTLIGGAGHDTFIVDNADARIDGGAGYDYLRGDVTTSRSGLNLKLEGTSVEYVDASNAADVIDATGTVKGTTTEIDGHAGADTVIDGAGTTWFYGGDGADTIKLTGNLADYTIKPVAGWWAGWTQIIDNATGTDDWVMDVERLEFADQTIGDPTASSHISGTAGADVLAGTDTVDVLKGGDGADELRAGGGNDALYIDNTDTVVDGGEGWDVAYTTEAANRSGLTFKMAGTGIESVWSGMGNDVIDTRGVEAKPNFWYEVVTRAGDDTVIAGDAALNVAGGAGNDTLVLSGNRADYTAAVTTDADIGDQITLTHTETGVVNYAWSIETFQFADGAVAQTRLVA